jgi:mRNA-degrading endonuclease toxin of MazEF toxin-antitoxin module
MVTTNIRLASTEPTQVLIDITSPDGQATGLLRTSAVKCENLFTLPQASVVRTIGQLSATLMQQVEEALKSSLNLQ